MKPVRKLYILSDSVDGKEDIKGNYLLIDDTGKVVYTHTCSSIRYAKKDLILSRPSRLEECSKIYGKDFKVLFLGEDNMTLDELVSLYNKNHKEKG